MVRWSSGWSLTSARSMLQDRHPSHCDSISIKLVQAGEYQNQVGAGTVMVLHDHLHNTRTLRIANKFQSQSGFQLKNLSSYHTCFVSWQLQNLPISGLMVLQEEDGTITLNWMIYSQHHITSISHSQKKGRGCEGREQQSFYSLN